MAVCSCDTGVTAFGLTDCYGKPDYVVGFGFINMKSDGVNYNTISGSSNVSQSIWEGLLWNNDPKQRLNLLKNVKEVTDEREDATTETIDEIDYFIRDGKRMVSFSVVGAPDLLKTVVEGIRCGNYGFFTITASGQIGGWKATTNASSLRPIAIEKGTLQTKVIQATKSTQKRVMVMFQVAESFDDGTYGFIPSENIGADLIGTNALLSGLIVGAPVIAATSVTVHVDWELNGSTTVLPLEGLDTIAYWSLYNETTSATVTITAVTETAAGTYQLTYAAQTALNVIRISRGAAAPFTFDSFTYVAV
jgi:hypothetical protein